MTGAHGNDLFVPEQTLRNEEPTGIGLWSCLQADPTRPQGGRAGTILWRLVKIGCFVAVVYYVMH